MSAFKVILSAFGLATFNVSLAAILVASGCNQRSKHQELPAIRNEWVRWNLTHFGLNAVPSPELAAVIESRVTSNQTLLSELEHPGSWIAAHVALTYRKCRNGFPADTFSWNGLTVNLKKDGSPSIPTEQRSALLMRWTVLLKNEK